MIASIKLIIDAIVKFMVIYKSNGEINLKYIKRVDYTKIKVVNI